MTSQPTTITTSAIATACRHAWLHSQVPATQDQIERIVWRLMPYGIDREACVARADLRVRVCQMWDARYHGSLRRQKAASHDPLSAPIQRLAFRCDGRLYPSRRAASGRATAVQCATRRLTYQGMLSGSYRPEIVAVVVRGQ